VPAIVLVAAGHVFRATPEIKERGWMAAIPTSALVLMVPVLRPDRQAYCDIPYGPIPGSRSTPGVRERLCFELVRHRLQDEDWTWYQTLLLEMVTAPPPSPYENAGFEWRSRSDRCLGSMRWADGQKLQWRYESPDLSARVVLKTRRAWPAGVEILGRAYYMRTRGGTTAEWRAVARTQGLRDLSFEGLLTGRCGNGPPQPWSDKLRVLADRTTTGPSLRYDIELDQTDGDSSRMARCWARLSQTSLELPLDRPESVDEILTPQRCEAIRQYLTGSLTPFLNDSERDWALYLLETGPRPDPDDLAPITVALTIEVIVDDEVLADGYIWFPASKIHNLCYYRVRESSRHQALDTGRRAGRDAPGAERSDRRSSQPRHGSVLAGRVQGAADRLSVAVHTPHKAA